MSLPEFSAQSSLFGVPNLLGSQFDPADRFRLFSEKIQPLLVATRPVLETCYCAENGRPAAEPVLLLGISLLQFMERLPDRAAMEMVKYHLGWKLALGTELDLSAPDPSTLSYFRQRLLEHEQAKLAFDMVLEGLRAAGLVARRSKQRLDSTHVLGAVARLSGLECCREALRLALQEVAEAELGRPESWELMWERYVQSKLDYRLEEAALAEKYLEVGRDMAAVVAWAGQQKMAEVSGGKHMQVLKRVLEEQFELVEGALRKRVRVGGWVQNPHDAEAEWSAKGKSGKGGWVGYKVQVAETVAEGKLEEGEPTRSFLTAVETQAATGGEVAGMEQVLEAQKRSGLASPPELYVDSGYVTAAKLKEAAEQGRELVGPALGSSHQLAGFRTEDFDVDVEKRRATCPAGQPSSSCARLEDKSTGQISYRFEWSGACGSCPFREQCLGPDKQRRRLEVGEHHSYLQQRRREQKTEAFAERMHRRNGIEGTISELTRGHGLRRCRYRGLEKARQQNYFVGAACNVKRWLRHTGWEIRRKAKQVLSVISAGLGVPPGVAAAI